MILHAQVVYQLQFQKAKDFIRTSGGSSEGEIMISFSAVNTKKAPPGKLQPTAFAAQVSMGHCFETSFCGVEPLLMISLTSALPNSFPISLLLQFSIRSGGATDRLNFAIVPLESILGSLVWKFALTIRRPSYTKLASSMHWNSAGLMSWVSHATSRSHCSSEIKAFPVS